MSGPLVWWANRKSRMGMKPSAIKPPHKPGKEWWTNPPTTVPQPEHMEYVAQYQLQLMAQPPSEKRQLLMMHLSAWWRAARQVLHEEMTSEFRADLCTTDGICIAAEDALKAALVALSDAGVKPGDERRERVREVLHALQRRNTKVRRERAIESSKRRSA